MKLKTTFLTATLITSIFTLSGSDARADLNETFFFKTSAQYKDVVVEEVIDSARFLIRNHQNRNERIRLIGLGPIKAPKALRDKREKDEYGFRIVEEVSAETPLNERAFTFTKDLLEGKRVRIEFDSLKVDDGSNTLGYVYLLDTDTFVNTEVLRQGFAHLKIRPENKKHAKELRAAYREAREELRGLHGE